MDLNSRSHIFPTSLRKFACHLGKIAVLLVFISPVGCAEIERPGPVERQPAYPPQDFPALTGKLEAPLLRYMDKARPEESIPVILIFERQVTEAEKVRLFSQIKTDDPGKQKAERRKLLVAELKRVAQADQRRVAGLLRDLAKEQQVHNVRPLWISNVIGVTAPKAIINRLTAFSEIMSPVISSSV